jgi:hypothetical protein
LYLSQASTFKEQKYKPLYVGDLSEDDDLRNIVYGAATYTYLTVQIILCSIPSLNPPRIQ